MDNSSTKFGIPEVVGRLLLVLLSFASFRYSWWLPLVVAPLFHQFYDTILCRKGRIHNALLKLLADFLTYIVSVAYIVSSIYLFGMNVGHWYGWLMGFIIGIVIVQFLGLLFPQRWHLEKMEGRL